MRFNDAPSTFEAVSDSVIHAWVPADASSGPVSVTNAGGTATSGTAFQVGALTPVEEAGPLQWSVTSAVPNPSTAHVHWALTLPSRARVRASVIDVTGAQVRSLIAWELGAGRHDLMWDGRNERGARVTPGRYFLNVEAPDRSLRTSFVVLR